ncbi:putative universal stress protein [Sporotomaculum syntrophicum]|uniref:Universal stress protein n=1 Tax=Sporotomaculum syntrophicum TaxID=182264 RepID=A0A9D3AZ02_9FIRM|nr:universal stress protein [Sporotomaculum syntrophicum]KAF1085349.1 putative universal stress protein [Sporotomaculum syntrophicum]
MYKKILVPLDGSAPSLDAAKQAIEIAAALGSQLTFLHVLPTLGSYINLPRLYASESYNQLLQEFYAQGEHILDNALKEIDTKGLSIDRKLESGDPAMKILEIAREENYDLIVMGNRGLSGAKEVLLGSVSSRIADHASCPVLIVR